MKDNAILDKNISMLIQKWILKLLRNIISSTQQKKNRTRQILIHLNCINGGARSGTLKYVTGYNHYRARNIYVNKELCTNKCPQYNDNENQEYVTRCGSINKIRNEYTNIIEEDLNTLLTNDSENK